MNKSALLTKLVEEYKKDNKEETLKKIIYLNQNTINWYLENTKSNLQQDELNILIMEAILKACLKYNATIHGNVINFFELCIRNEIFRKIRSNIQDKRLFENFLQVKEIIETKYGITLAKDFSIFDDIIDEMCAERLITYSDIEEVKLRLLSILKDYYGSLINYTHPLEENPYRLELNTDLLKFKNIVRTTLSKKEFDYLSSLYGLDGCESKSLTEVGAIYQVSKEFVRQVCEKAISKLNNAFDYYFNCKVELPFKIEEIKNILKNILTEEEWQFLILKFGLFGNTEMNYEKIGQIYNKDAIYIGRIVAVAIEKIRMALNSIMIELPFDLKLFKEYLKKTLSQKEFLIFCHKYGLYGYSKLSIEEMVQKYHLSNKTIISKVRKSFQKMKETFKDEFDTSEVNVFLQSILTEQEYIFLILNLGLFGNNQKSYKELSELYQMTLRATSNIVKTAICKINTLLIISSIDFDFNLIKEFLEKILTDTEFKCFCSYCGLYGYDKQSMKEISANMKIDSHIVQYNNLMASDKIKRYLNVDRNIYNKIISN